MVCLLCNNNISLSMARMDAVVHRDETFGVVATMVRDASGKVVWVMDG